MHPCRDGRAQDNGDTGTHDIAHTLEDARKAYEAVGGKPASTGAQVEGAQNGETAIGFADPTKAAKTGGEE